MSASPMGTCPATCAACRMKSAGGCLRIRPTLPRSRSPQHECMEREQDKEVKLEDAVSFALDEARMILPGIQALFGFQLVAVFNQRFADIFDEPGQLLHLAALVLVALSCALAMTPAAVHRQVHRGRVSTRL